MAASQHEVKRAPIGMDDNADISLRAQERCLLMLGLASNSPGVLERALHTKKIYQHATGTSINGIFPYYADSAANDKIVLMLGGALYTVPMTAGIPNAYQQDALKPYFSSAPDGAPATPALITNNSGVTLPSASSDRYRAVQIGTELIIVERAGLQPVRFNGTNLYKLGITKPAVPTLPSTGAGALSGSYQWLYTYADELGRESSPSPVTVNTTLAAVGQNVTVAASADAQVQKIYIYRRTATGTVFYRIKEAGYTNTNQTVLDNGTTTASDTLLVLNTQAPSTSENEVPNPATVLAVWNNRLALNDTTDVRAVQISNLNAPGQFSLEGIDGLATDGLTTRVLVDQGDDIVGLGHMGDALGVWTRRHIGVILGDRPWEFRYHAVQPKGLIAPDSLAQGINETYFMAEDGVYAIGYNSGFALRKVSGDLDKMFQSVSVNLYAAPWGITPTGTIYRYLRGYHAQGFFVQNRYILAVAPYTCIYDTDTGGWALDYMQGVNSTYLTGYTCGSVVSVNRQWDLIVFNPQSGSPGEGLGSVWVSSFYPLQHTTSTVAEPWYFAYQMRAFDGAGVHRASKKEVATVTVFGEHDATQIATDGLALNSGGAASLAASLQLQVDYTVQNSGAAAYDTRTETISPDPAQANYNVTEDRRQGILLKQQFTINEGRIISAVFSGTVNAGRLNVRDVMVEYTRQD